MVLTLFGLECVLQHMEANLRFRISNRCPTIRPIEKRVPLTIQHFEVEKNQLNINDTKYRLGVYQLYPKDMFVPEEIDIANREFGFQYDLDLYGIATKRKNQLDYHRMRAQLDKMKKELARKPMDEALQNEIKKLDGALRPHIFKRDNFKPPWSLLVKLTILSTHDRPRVEFGKYTNLKQNLSELASHFFGDRKSPIFLKQWNFGNKYLVLPEKLKFRVKSLVLSWSQDPWIVEQNLDESSYPLEMMRVDETGVYPHPMILNAKRLEVSSDIPLARLGEFKCEQLEVDGTDFREEDYCGLVGMWLGTGKAIGTCFEFKRRHRNENILEVLMTRFNGIMEENGVLKIPMSSSLEIQVSSSEVDPALNYFHSCILGFKIVPV